MAAEDLPETESGKPSPAASLWAMLIARIYAILPWQFVPEKRHANERSLRFLPRNRSDSAYPDLPLGEPTTPPGIASARAPPDWIEADFDPTVLNESENVEPIPEFEFDQTVS
ncbi:MAG: hypothetical protein ACREEM_42670 [Blastocatellia bacterium]